MDKVLHFVVGFVLSFLAKEVTGDSKTAVAISGTISAAKEIYDLTGGAGTPDILDFIAGLLGAFFGVMI